MVDGVPTRDAVTELEQAGDSAKAAAEADTRLAPEVRESVLAAHLAICKLKAVAGRAVCTWAGSVPCSLVGWCR